MGPLLKVDAPRRGVAGSTGTAGRERPGGIEPGKRSPASARQREILHKWDVDGEKAIAIAQAAVALFIMTLHVVAQLRGGLQMGNPWVVLALSALAATSIFRLRISRSGQLPERALDALNVVDIALFLGLIWSYQFAYQHPAGGVLKAPSVALLFILVAARALRFHPRPVLVAGGSAALGWALIVVLAALQDGAPAITRSYTAYLTSYNILFGAEIERLMALAR